MILHAASNLVPLIAIFIVCQYFGFTTQEFMWIVICFVLASVLGYIAGFVDGREFQNDRS